MYIKRINGPRAVTLPDGTTMTRADLPPVDTRRWVASRKATVVKAIAAGLISQDEAMARYALSEEELEGWRRAIADHGLKALKTTKIQRYRQP
ncbi:CtrA inhibitor SciP [Actibacterium sp. D379-3]